MLTYIKKIKGNMAWSSVELEAILNTAENHL